jgi:iron complex outermembrane receptor protein
VANISQLNLNIFDEEQPLAYAKPIGPNLFIYKQQGKNRFTGVEFTSTSLFPFGLTLNAGVTLLKPLQVDTGDPTLNGKYVPGASRHSAAVYAEYRMPTVPNLGLTANVTYNSSTPLLATNGYDIGGYTIADLGGFYKHPVGDIDVTYRMILTNAFDTRYLSPYYSSVTVGAPRTLLASVSARFGGRN